VLASLELAAQGRRRLNALLDGCFWNACYFDVEDQIGAVVVELVGVQVKQYPPQHAFPVLMVGYPVSRIAASWKRGGKIQRFDLEDVNSVLHEFSANEIDDWDIIDPPEDQRFRWREDLSLDVTLEGSEDHMLEMWQDEEPFQTFDMAFWFKHLFLFDMSLRPLDPGGIEEARDGGWWNRTNAVPEFSCERLLRMIKAT
jgi:hypothetical protein